MDEEGELMIIKHLYPGFIMTKLDGAVLTKLLVAYNKQNIFLTIIEKLIKDKGKKLKEFTELKNGVVHVKPKEEVYNSGKMLLQSVQFCLKFENIDFLNLVLTKYEDEALIYPFKIAKYFLRSL